MWRMGTHTFDEMSSSIIPLVLILPSRALVAAESQDGTIKYTKRHRHSHRHRQTDRQTDKHKQITSSAQLISCKIARVYVSSHHTHRHASPTLLEVLGPCISAYSNMPAFRPTYVCVRAYTCFFLHLDLHSKRYTQLCGISKVKQMCCMQQIKTYFQQSAHLQSRNSPVCPGCSLWLLPHRRCSVSEGQCAFEARPCGGRARPRAA